MDHDFAILTPEKTILTYRLAGVGSRILAHFLDVLVILALLTALSFVAGILGMVDESMAMIVVLMSGFLLPFLYFILLEWLWNGQTIGKRAAHLRVAMEDGTPITFMASLSRNILRPGDFLPLFYFVGMIAIFTNPKSQRLGDLVAKTIVLHEKAPGKLYVMAPHSAGIHQYEEVIGELRGMTLAEYDACRRLCDRFFELSPDSQRKLLRDVWIPIAQRRNIPAPSGVHPLRLAEATVMKYGRKHGLI
ncbi:MAG TPA: RDD family protein [Fimbriimonas sp.]|nr:RDD family protein [Fimbriimonas sp.]